MNIYIRYLQIGVYQYSLDLLGYINAQDNVDLLTHAYTLYTTNHLIIYF